MKLLLSSAILSFLLIGVGACSKSSSSTSGGGGGGGSTSCGTVPPSFSANVLPLIQTRCATSPGCHAAGSTNSGGPLTNYSQVFSRRSNVKSSVQNGSMPQGSTLTTAEKNIIICWVDNGAPNN
jgi:hypothetical protein